MAKKKVVESTDGEVDAAIAALPAAETEVKEKSAKASKTEVTVKFREGADDFKSRQSAGFARGASLRIGEVRRDGNDRLLRTLSQ